MEDKDVVRSLAALAQDLRLKLFRALVVAGRQGMTPGVMAEGAGVPPATVSFHLKELLNAGLVSQERVGRNLVYRVSFERVDELMRYLTANCCAGEACAELAVPACNC
jgi:DNA-binding transcriptional ArsR family regulator